MIIKYLNFLEMTGWAHFFSIKQEFNEIWDEKLW